MNIHIPLLFDRDPIYVADMTEHHQLDETMTGLVDFGVPAAAAASTLIAATAITASSTVYFGDSDLPTGDGVQVDDAFGRTLNVTSTDAGDLTVFGRDYLNQPMSETVTCIVGTVETTKAFKFIDRAESDDVAGNISFGPGTELGMPFVVSEILAEYTSGAPAGDPTLTAADATTPSATTGDVRGTVDPATTIDGVNNIEMTVRFNNKALGGLFGQRQA